MALPTISKNGNTGNGKTEATGKQPTVAETKPELSNLTVNGSDLKETKPALTTISERLQKFHEMEKLFERRELLADSVENLLNFYIAPTGAGASIKLQDSKGKTFAIAHPTVIGEIVALTKSKLEAELQEIDANFML